MVRVKRLELSHLAILEPKSSASTNSAKPAHWILFLFTIYTAHKMAGIRGFEPLNDGIKTRCLTAWLYPYNVPTFTFATMLRCNGAGQET